VCSEEMNFIIPYGNRFWWLCSFDPEILPVSLSQVSYCSMMDAYAKVDRVQEAHEMFDKMQAKGIKPGMPVCFPFEEVHCSFVVNVHISNLFLCSISVVIFFYHQTGAMGIKGLIGTLLCRQYRLQYFTFSVCQSRADRGG
jgi:pentatricopeptide repeat protein